MQTVESVDYMVDTDSMGWWDHQCFLRQFEAPCLVNSRSLVFHHFRHFRLCFMGLSVPKRVIELGCWAPRSVSASDNASNPMLLQLSTETMRTIPSFFVAHR